MLSCEFTKMFTPNTIMLLYSVLDQEENTIKNVAFKFIDERSFMRALIRTIEGSIRGFVAIKKQAEVLGLRKDITEHVKEQIDKILEEWGFHLQDLQLNDITFDEAMRVCYKYCQLHLGRS